MVIPRIPTNQQADTSSHYSMIIVPICFSNPICTEVTIVCMYPPAKDIKLVSKKTFRNSDES